MNFIYDPELQHSAFCRASCSTVCTVGSYTQEQTQCFALNNVVMCHLLFVLFSLTSIWSWPTVSHMLVCVVCGLHLSCGVEWWWMQLSTICLLCRRQWPWWVVLSEKQQQMNTAWADKDIDAALLGLQISGFSPLSAWEKYKNHASDGNTLQYVADMGTFFPPRTLVMPFGHQRVKLYEFTLKNDHLLSLWIVGVQSNTGY